MASERQCGWRKRKEKPPHHPPQLASSWFPQPWHPVWRIRIGDCKTATRVYRPTRRPGTPLTVQPSPKKTSTSGVLPSQRLPTCGNVILLNDFTGINESSHALPQTSGGLARFSRGGQRIKPRGWRRHHQQTVGMSSNGVQVAMAPRHHCQCEIRGQSKGRNHKLRARTRGSRTTVAHDGARMWAPH
jgi:hypothetical protein